MKASCPVCTPPFPIIFRVCHFDQEITRNVSLVPSRAKDLLKGLHEPQQRVDTRIARQGEHFPGLILFE